MKHYKHSIIAFFALIILGTPWLISAYPESTRFVDNIFGYIGRNYTAVFFHEAVSVEKLQKKYESLPESQKKIRIMIVPGHEPDFGGTEFGKLKERDMNVMLANYIQDFLKNNSHYEVVMARDENKWNPTLESYFKDHWNEITSFVNQNKGEMIRLVNDGSVTKLTSKVFHNSAPQDVALRLFGINKWNNENNIDVAIHVHFNDYPRRTASTPGDYSGFAIYVPDRQYSNSTTTKAIADVVFKRLSKYNAVSNLPHEDSGVVEEQELIAIGSYNTVDAPSMLIEYGYIYEPQFTNSVVRESTLKDLAFQTYLGIQDFFGSGNDVSLAYDTLMLPHSWTETIDKKSADKADKNEVLALQSALIVEGMYPPQDKSKNECPRSGKFGPCTISSLSAFQKKYGITGEINMVGEKTKKILNDRFSGRII